MAERLEQVRKRENLSQEAFSQRLGISRGAYQHYSRGGREIPSSVLDALLREFEIDPYWMLRGDDHGSATKIEAVLVNNAARIAYNLIEAYSDQNIKFTEDKIASSTSFATLDIFDKRTPVSGHRDKIRKFASS